MTAMTDTANELARLTADVALFGTGTAGELHVLLIKRRWEPFQGCWALPGGHVDTGEDTEHAARRELNEEAGLLFDRLTLAGVYATPGRDPRGRYVTFAYTATLAHLPKPTAADDAAEAAWIPLAELPALPLAFDHDQIIRYAQRLGA